MGLVQLGKKAALRRFLPTTRAEMSERGWAELDITMSQSGRTCTLGYARVALPTEPADNPWARHGDRWRPAPAE